MKNLKKLTTAAKPKPTVRVNPKSSIYTGDTIILSCELQKTTGWEFQWYKNNENLQNQYSKQANTLNMTAVSAGEAVYQCNARRKNGFNYEENYYYTEPSNPVKITVREAPFSVLMLISSVVTASPYLLITIILLVKCYRAGGNSVSYVKICTCKNSTLNQFKGSGLISILLVAQAQGKPKPTLRVKPQSLVYTGDTVTLICELQQGTGWEFQWYKKPENSQHQNTEHPNILKVTAENAGETAYQCRAHRINYNSKYYHTDLSDPVSITAKEAPFSVLMLISSVVTASPYLLITIILLVKCYRARVLFTFMPDVQTKGHWGDSVSSEVSDAVTLTVSAKPKPTIRVNPQSSIFTGDTITLSCELQETTGWGFKWYKNNLHLQIQNSEPTNTLNVTVDTAGETLYWCNANRTNHHYISKGNTYSYYHTEHSDPVIITGAEAFPRTQQRKESIVGMAEVLHNLPGSGPAPRAVDVLQARRYNVPSAARRRYDVPFAARQQHNDLFVASRYTGVEWHPQRNSGAERRPRGTLLQRRSTRGDSVAARNARGDSVAVSSARGDSVVARSVRGDFVETRSARGDSVAVRHACGDSVAERHGTRPKPVTSINPDKQVFSGDTVTLRCEIQDESVSRWQYSWYKDASLSHVSSVQMYRISSVEVTHTGKYTCKGRESGGSRSSHLSDAVTLTVSERPQAVLSVSPQNWLTEGDSVTLSCEVTDSSTDWTFSWYTVVPYRDGLTEGQINHGYIMYVELLSDSTRGSGGNYTLSPSALHHTGVYVCRGERGEPVSHILYSNPQPLWISGESPPVSLIISPSRTQHFTRDSLSLSCEDQSNSTGWTVRRYTDSEGVLDCSQWGSVTGSTCNISFLSTNYTGVYWCESKSGENSSRVNITVHDGGVILESSVHPVTEGHPLTLHCLYRNTNPSKLRADFYKDGSVVQNQTTGEMIIHKVSKSDEGFYHCKHPERGESPRSWISVRHLDSKFSVETGVVVGLSLVFVFIVLLILMILLWCCKMKKEKQQKSSQTSEQNQRRSGAEDSQSGHKPLQTGADAQLDNNDVTYAEVQLKPMKKAKRAQVSHVSVYTEEATDISMRAGNL
ncbi:Fc receptor-like protein 5 [Silurus meridionalis]|nr:Fc receptor-like protein 5 [Silurus meridionalis]